MDRCHDGSTRVERGCRSGWRRKWSCRSGSKVPCFAATNTESQGRTATKRKLAVLAFWYNESYGRVGRIQGPQQAPRQILNKRLRACSMLVVWRGEGGGGGGGGGERDARFSLIVLLSEKDNLKGIELNGLVV
ncbi:hypothetical protein HZH68_004336 [Vespula germanica]|uniref:Uncharacterized protein n=1 Tax=Vespula germanica TaxID=30212 RepID=A0A834NI72_VESGE|nr:hypothetical protein HZH68_004336 [Vespula germanica]